MSEILDRPAAAERPYRLETSAGHLMRRAHQRYQALFGEAAAGIGLTGPQFATLLRLAEAGRCTQNQLGRLAAMDSATAHGVARRLQERGLVRAAPDPMDRRTRVLSVTAEGHLLLAQAKHAGKRANEALLQPLSPEERALLLSLLGRLSG
ncbi:MarR family winged helix-turn-helix transcriptional regulator [Roseococcus sp. DSY-14]|uniref:MarR family winged helix-turn-helix transcriptional regulator n=1 Tax=Roseococcus sp. DSY-14 TaxID=3369650 RepID=UPI00387AE999